MPFAVPAELASLWTSVGAAALVSACVQIAAKFYFDRKLAEISEEQKRVGDRLQATFSTLQAERAAVIKAMYAKIVETQSRLKYIASEDRVTEESAKSYADAVDAFVGYFRPNDIWLPKSVADRVEELIGLMFPLRNQIVTAKRDVPLAAFEDGLRSVQRLTTTALEELQAAFRGLLGVDS